MNIWGTLCFQEQIYQLMQNDIYPRFVKSSQYTDMVKAANSITSQGRRCSY